MVTVLKRQHPIPPEHNKDLRPSCSMAPDMRLTRRTPDGTQHNEVSLIEATSPKP